VHHLLTVDGLTPICIESHRAVRFFSTNTTFSRFISSILIVLFHKGIDLFSIVFYFAQTICYFRPYFAIFNDFASIFMVLCLVLEMLKFQLFLIFP